MLLDGSSESDRKLRSMLYFDVNNGIARRAWARNSNALKTMEREAKNGNTMQVTLPFMVEDTLINSIF